MTCSIVLTIGEDRNRIGRAVGRPTRSDEWSFQRSYGRALQPRHCKDLVRMFIQVEMIIADVRARHMPVEVLRLKIEPEYIGEERVESSRPDSLEDYWWKRLHVVATNSPR